MQVVLLPFILLSAVGLVLSLWSHFSAIMGSPQPLGHWASVLHVGVFAVWLPAILVSQRMAQGSDRQNFLNVALRGCPTWLRCVTFGFFGYAFVNIILVTMDPHEEKAGGKLRPFDDAPASVWRGLSGHWMAFYAVAFSTLYSAAVNSVGEAAGKKASNKHSDELDELIA